MDNKITVKQETAITAGMTREQIELIKATVARGASDNELKLFLYTANRTGLDPLTKQIHFIKRRVWNSQQQAYDEVGTIQTGIDGYRVVAARNGLAGIEDAVFDSEDGKHPNKATVCVYRLVNGTRVPFTASARWNEYVQAKKDGTPIAMWAKMPYLMLAKVAEALALRKAFPNDLSGVYTNEEMSQADAPIEVAEELPKTYTIERKMPAADDEQGGSTVEKEAVQEEIQDAQKEQIKNLLKILKKPAQKKVIKELTGFDMEPANYQAILKKLGELADAEDAFAQNV